MKRITGKDLLRIGFEENIILGKTLDFCENYKGSLNKGEVLNILKNVIEKPSEIFETSDFYPLAQQIIALQKEMDSDTIPLETAPKPYAVFGNEHIEEGARKQMETAMKLPVSVAGALMPDAH